MVKYYNKSITENVTVTTHIITIIIIYQTHFAPTIQNSFIVVISLKVFLFGMLESTNRSNKSIRRKTKETSIT